VTGTLWLLDTNVLSELRRPRPNHKVLAFIGAHSLQTYFVSTVTLAEIRFGIEVVDAVETRAALADWLQQTVRPMFEGRTLQVTEDVMFKWRLLVEKGRKARHTFSQPDLLIAATALCHGLTVVSRDTREYARSGVAVVDPRSVDKPE
jgi:toxin FitB